MQDRQLNFNPYNYQTTDAYFAYHTHIEGDARFYELLFANDSLTLGYNQSNIAQRSPSRSSEQRLHKSRPIRLVAVRRQGTDVLSGRSIWSRGIHFRRQRRDPAWLRQGATTHGRVLGGFPRYRSPGGFRVCMSGTRCRVAVFKHHERQRRVRGLALLCIHAGLGREPRHGVCRCSELGGPFTPACRRPVTLAQRPWHGALNCLPRRQLRW